MINIIKIFLFLIISSSIFANNNSSYNTNNNSSKEIGLYVFGSTVKGDAKINNIKSDVDLHFKKLLNYLDFALEGYAKYTKPNWSGVVDLIAVKLSDSVKFSTLDNKLSLKINAEFKQIISQFYLTHILFKNNSNKFQLHGLAGFRYNKFDLIIDEKARLLGLNIQRDKDYDYNWIDPIIGLDFIYKINEHIQTSLLIDTGKIGNKSRQSSNNFVKVDYLFDSGYKLFIAARYYNIKISSNNLKTNLNYFGPLLGIAKQFN